MMMQQQNQKFKQNCQTSLHKFLQLFYHQAKATSQIYRGPRSIRPGDTEHTIIINIIITVVIHLMKNYFIIVTITIIITVINILPHYLDQDKCQQWGGVGRTWARLELCDKGSR